AGVARTGRSRVPGSRVSAVRAVRAERARRERVEPGGLCRRAADGDGDAVDGRDPLVLEGSEDGVVDEVGSALSDGVVEAFVRFLDLGLEEGEVAVDLGLCGGGDRRQL